MDNRPGTFCVDFNKKSTEEFEAKILSARTTTQLTACIYPRIKDLTKKYIDLLDDKRTSDSFKLEKQELLQHLCIVIFNRGGRLFTDVLNGNPMMLDKAHEQVRKQIEEAIDVCVALAGIDCTSEQVNIDAIITHYRETF